jgi:hypothetical protein
VAAGNIAAPVTLQHRRLGYPALNPADPNQLPSDGVGRYGKFTITFDSRVTKYAYAMNTNPSEGSAVARASTASESVPLIGPPWFRSIR